jgi:murein DD-endopeptidase MepM/ murein hydrolase activator NlpD
MGGVELRRVSAPHLAGRIGRIAIVAGFSAGLAACSGDTARFNSNPFDTAQETTGSARPARVARTDIRPVYSSQALPPPTVPAAPAPVAGGYQPPRGNDVTGANAGQRKWTWEGGTPVIVAQGETVDSMALRYNVPGTAILQANELAPGTTLRAGQSIVIPKVQYASQRSAPAQVASAAPPLKASLATTQVTHVVAPGETMMSLSRRYHKPLKDIVVANRLTSETRLKVGDRIVIPGVTASSAPATKPAAPATVVAAQPAPTPVATAKPHTPPAPQRVASLDPPTQTARLASPSIDTSEKTGSTGAPQFRWPVRGRVISGFGPIPNGQQNDGINLAVPEGTQVRAAEDGTVAYAGNELKGYGNLVLVRHSDGYVTAYAHASELMVKRGDAVKRGQVIAKSGATGSVNAPQLHFEIRKGSSPVDPTKYLPGA